MARRPGATAIQNASRSPRDGEGAERVEPEEGVKIAIAIPALGSVPALFMYDMAKMMCFMGEATQSDENPIDGVFITLLAHTYIHSARQGLAEVALEQGADYIMWFDADMRFPKDIIFRLLRHRKQMVGINYSTRTMPPSFVAIKQCGWEPGDDGIRLETTEDSTGLEQVEAIGFGAVLMSTTVFDGLHNPRGPEGPWFWNKWLPDKQQSAGEDVVFCDYMNKAGVEVWVDHDLSKECSHIGNFEYRVQHAVDFVDEFVELKSLPEEEQGKALAITTVGSL